MLPERPAALNPDFDPTVGRKGGLKTPALVRSFLSVVHGYREDI